MDLLISVLIVLVLYYLFLIQLQHMVFSEYTRYSKWENEQNALFLMDSLIKNRIEEQPRLGAAIVDDQKHRILSNELDPKLLEQLQTTQKESLVQFQRLEIRFFDGEYQLLFSNQTTSKNCFGIERPIVIQERKALLSGRVCRD